MKVTATLHNLTDNFYAEMAAMSASAQFEKLNKLRHDLPHCIKVKIGSGQFRDAVDLNSIMKKVHLVTSSIEPRKGYKLAIFNFTKATQ